MTRTDNKDIIEPICIMEGNMLVMKRGSSWVRVGVAALMALIFLAGIAGAQPFGAGNVRASVHPKVEDVLTELQHEQQKGVLYGQSFSQQRGIQVSDDHVTVFLVLGQGKTIKDLDTDILLSLGTRIIKSSDNMIKADVPVSMISQIADSLAGIDFIRLPDRAHPEGFVTEGVSLSKATKYHAIGYDGSGVKVAVIDAVFGKLDDAIAKGELPAGVTKIDCTGAGCSAVSGFPSFESQHGTGVAEIIHDMAPGAQLYLIKVADSLDVVDATNYCKSNGIRIINMSLGFYNQNFYDGTCYNANVVCSVKDAYANGILWVKSAGNSAKQHYEATFTDTKTVDDLHDTFILFDTFAGDGIDLYLTWNAWPVTNQDYDIYLYDYDLLVKNDPLALVAWSANDQQNGNLPPTEAIHYTANRTGTYVVIIIKYSAATNHQLELYTNQSLYPNVSESSLTGPADAAEAFAVGAIKFSKWTTGPQESFSSKGPNNNGWNKPEIAAPDRVSTYAYGAAAFAGTSAAAPHVAGAAALILQANPAYTLMDIWNALLGAAKDMGPAGQDIVYGYGRLKMPAVTAVDLLDPVGGETIISGGSYPVTWKAAPAATKFRLKYSLDNGLTWRAMHQDPYVPGTGYSWAISVPKEKNNSLVKITGYDNFNVKLGTDKSLPFRIVLPSPTGRGMEDENP